MSRTPRFFIEKRNENGEWEDVTLYIKDEEGEFKPLWLDTGNADYELFELIFEKLDGSYRGLPEKLGPLATKYFDEEEDGFSTLREAAKNTWYDYIELNLLAKTDEAMVIDYDAVPDVEGNYPKYNALESLISKVNWIMYENNIYFPEPGEVRILCSII